MTEIYWWNGTVVPGRTFFILPQSNGSWRSNGRQKGGKNERDSGAPLPRAGAGKAVRRERADPVFEMIRIEIDRDSWEKGKEDGREGRKHSVPPGVDSFSYCSGYIEGEALRFTGERSGNDRIHPDRKINHEERKNP